MTLLLHPRLITAGIILAIGPAAVTAQQVLLEGGVRAGDLWCYPMASDPQSYLYVPDRAALATDDEGRPQFSFITYSQSDKMSGSSKTDGGGILTFLVSYGVSAERRTRAQRDLVRLTDNRDAVLRGPVLFQSGSFSLVSSVLSGRGEATRAVLTAGRAPVLEGNRIALSFELDPERSTLLLGSFQTATPDVSLVFDMTFIGIAPAFDAELKVDWSKVHQNQAFNAGGSAFWVGAEVEAMFDEMRRDNAIELRSSGSDESMEALLGTVYDRLLKLMFEPVQPLQLPPDQQGGLFEALAKLAKPNQLAKLAGKTTGFGLGVGYKTRSVRDSGHTVLRFNHQSALERHATIAFNIGDLYRNWGDDRAFFRTVYLDDPTFDLREVQVRVDGALQPELERFVNSVSVTLEKLHQDGTQTLRELVLDARTFSGSAPDLRFVYGWRGDDDRDRWQDYRYRTQWSFRDGGSYDSGWVESDTPMINLYAPFQRLPVQLVGDSATLLKRDVRAVIVEISYPFFGSSRRQQRVVRLDKPLEEEVIELTLPRDEIKYDYRITWHLAGRDNLTTSGTDGSGLVWIDNLPSERAD